MKKTVLLTAIGFIAMANVLAAGGISVKAKGTVREGIYTSPDKGFQVKVPDLLRPGASIRDERLANGEGVVYFKDDLCREYFIHNVPSQPTIVGQSELERFVDERLLPGWTVAKQATIESVSAADIGRGATVEVRLRQPGGPCSVMTFGENGRMVTQPVPAQVLIYVFVEDGTVYEAGYILGDAGDIGQLFGPANRPADELLRDFVAGVSPSPAMK